MAGQHLRRRRRQRFRQRRMIGNIHRLICLIHLFLHCCRGKRCIAGSACSMKVSMRTVFACESRMVFPNTVHGFDDCRSCFSPPLGGIGVRGIPCKHSVCHTNTMLARGNVHFRDACAYRRRRGSSHVRTACRHQRLNSWRASSRLLCTEPTERRQRRHTGHRIVPIARPDLSHAFCASTTR